MAIIKEDKCVICGKPASVHVYGDAYCSECGKEMGLKILHRVLINNYGND